VAAVSWNDAHAFCRWLTDKERKAGILGANQTYRLPTDAEWTKAAGNGKYPWGDAWPPPPGAGNYADEAFAASMPVKGWPHVPGNDGYPYTSPVGTFRPNVYGLYDMGGNLWQWCEDWYQASMNDDVLLTKYPALNEDAGGSKYKVLRGSSWLGHTSDNLLSAYRSSNAPGNRFTYYGFRVVVVTGTPPSK
jgi:formylglycine-generating enzyme required for sulfatase activity